MADILGPARGVPREQDIHGTYGSNPLVCERGLSRKEAAVIDSQGKGGALIDERIMRRFGT